MAKEDVRILNSFGHPSGITAAKAQLVTPITPGGLIDEIRQGWAFALRVATVTPATAAHYFFSILNKADEPLLIDRIEGISATADVWTVDVGKAAVAAPTVTSAATMVIQNQLVGSLNDYAVKATPYCGVRVLNWEDGAVKTIDRLTAATALTKHDLTDVPIILEKGYALAVAAVTATYAITHFGIRYRHLMVSNTDKCV